MANSFPQFYSELLYPNTFSDNGSMELGGEENLMPWFDMYQSASSVQSSVPAMPYSDHYGLVSDMTVPTLPELNVGFYGAVQSFIGSHQPPPPREELIGLVPDLKPLYHDSGDIWGSQSNEMHGGVVEETNMKVASRYSEEERKERIVRYLKKRNQRNFNKTIKYACRKTLADRRTRVRGRFARNNEISGDAEMAPKSSPIHNLIQQSDSCHRCDHTNFQKKEEEESWLQELTASLMYLPYVPNYNGFGP